MAIDLLMTDVVISRLCKNPGAVKSFPIFASPPLIHKREPCGSCGHTKYSVSQSSPDIPAIRQKLVAMDRADWLRLKAYLQAHTIRLRVMRDDQVQTLQF